MTQEAIPVAVQMIPIEHIAVANPRVRNQRIFKGIVENIAEIGLIRARRPHDGKLPNIGVNEPRSAPPECGDLCGDSAFPRSRFEGLSFRF